MTASVTVTFKDFEHSDAVETRVRERAEKLTHFYDRIVECRVVLQAPHKHRHKGKLYSVRIDLIVPGAELVVNHGQHEKHQHEDVYVAIRDAFQAMERQLSQFADKHRGHDGPKKEVAE